MSAALQVEAHQLGPAPAVLAWSGSREAARAKGTVLLFHGLTSDKRSMEGAAQALAARGYLAAAIDLVGHGQRAWADQRERFSGPSRRAEAVFLGVIKDSAAEVPAILTALEVTDRAALVGFSAGGYVGYLALQNEPRLELLCAINASPRWALPWPESPHLHPERFPPKAMLSCVCSDDEIVDPEPARALHRALTPLYSAMPERLRLVELSGERHVPSADGWLRIWVEVGRFLELLR